MYFADLSATTGTGAHVKHGFLLRQPQIILQKVRVKPVKPAVVCSQEGQSNLPLNLPPHREGIMNLSPVDAEEDFVDIHPECDDLVVDGGRRTMPPKLPSPPVDCRLLSIYLHCSCLSVRSSFSHAATHPSASHKKERNKCYSTIVS